MKCRYDCSGKWLKGNVHTHTTVSDGQRTPLDTAKLYADSGYDFLAITDHDIPSFMQDVENPPCILLDGMELMGTADNAAFHALCLGTFPDFKKGEKDFYAALDDCKAAGGIVALAHPHLQNKPSEALGYDYDGVEIYNTLGELFCKNDNRPHWDLMMDHTKRANPDVLAFAVDDTHAFGPAADGGKDNDLWRMGWIMVNCQEQTRESVFDAMKVGNFYSSAGPSFESIEITDQERIVIHTSAIRTAWVVGGYWQVLIKGMPVEDDLFTTADFELPDWAQLRIIIEDEHGRKAWSNNILSYA